MIFLHDILQRKVPIFDIFIREAFKKNKKCGNFQFNRLLTSSKFKRSNKIKKVFLTSTFVISLITKLKSANVTLSSIRLTKRLNIRLNSRLNLSLNLSLMTPIFKFLTFLKDFEPPPPPYANS